MSVRHGQAGFTLIEVLIAIVIFSIGLLGIAGLQVAGMRFTHDSQLRSIAVAQAETMADLMRANEFGMQSGFYNVQSAMPTTFNPDCSAVVCSAQERAIYDLKVWNTKTVGAPLQSNADVLPLGRGVVCRDSTPDDGTFGAWACDNKGTKGSGSMYAIKVEWQERTTGRDDIGERGRNTDRDVQSNKRFVMTVIPSIDKTVP